MFRNMHDCSKEQDHISTYGVMLQKTLDPFRSSLRCPPYVNSIFFLTHPSNINRITSTFPFDQANDNALPHCNNPMSRFDLYRGDRTVLLTMLTHRQPHLEVLTVYERAKADTTLIAGGQISADCNQARQTRTYIRSTTACRATRRASLIEQKAACETNQRTGSGPMTHDATIDEE